jgi:hypothetical protein
MRRKLLLWVAVMLASAALLVGVFLWGMQRQAARRDRERQRIREIDDRIVEINMAKKANRVKLASDTTRRREMLEETIRLIEEKQDLQEELGASLISRFQSLFH